MVFLTIKNESKSEYIEKRSKFLGTAFPCKTEAEALNIIDSVKTKYWDARHNCYAFIVDEGRTSRFSDDGEPHGTAGKPILEVINGKKLVNVLVVVTRYFGGVLLGTGGLVRAYTTATKEALENATTVEMIPCTVCEVCCDYQDHGTLLKLTESKAEILGTSFAEKVTLSFALKDEDIEDYKKSLTETFSARLSLTEKEKRVIGFNI
ncbi:MAG: YigZ family protein [Clostridia bacterium]|nr:YigZ family protein [Clostridia bacterium]